MAWSPFRLMVERDERRKLRPGLAGLMAFLFAFYVNYVPFHLLSEPHGNDAAHSMHSAAVGEDHHGDGDDDDHHAPHPASDHAIRILPKSESVFLSLVFLPAASVVLLEKPEPLPTVPLTERIKPPGESPPDPLQPRAPPLV